MNEHRTAHVCHVGRAGALDNPARRIVHNPSKILKPFIKPGDKVLDMGCGPGFFTFEIARLVGPEGCVYAADLQEGMLDIVRKKIPGSGMQERIRTHKCDESAINLNDRVDFILAFYMIHELASPDNTLSEFKTLLKPGGRILIIEPKFHVRKGAFHIMISRLEKAGFIIIERPKYFMSRAILVSTK